MVVGKTQSSITVEEIFNYFTEAEVLSSVFPEIDSLPCLINSPLRQDKHPSFSIYMNNAGNIRFIDFASGDKGGLLDLLCKYWNCSFTECLERLNSMLIGRGNLKIVRTQSKGIKTYKRTESRVEVKIRKWEDYDIEYWKSYGCKLELLKHAEVYPISHKIIYKDNKKHTFAAPRYSYVFIERKEGKITKKLYSPFASKYKWITDNDSSVIGLWDKVPKYGDKIIICSSLKDAICLWGNSGIPCIYIQGEAYSISDTAIKELKRRFKKVYICLDNDLAGITDAKKLQESTGFINIEIPQFQGGKDISDAYKIVGEEKFKETIVSLF